MTTKEAFDILAKAGAEFRGTLQDHKLIQDALSVINNLIKSNDKSSETGKNGK